MSDKRPKSIDELLHSAVDLSQVIVTEVDMLRNNAAEGKLEELIPWLESLVEKQSKLIKDARLSLVGGRRDMIIARCVR